MTSYYPANFYDDEWGRIHQGHGLSRYTLWADLCEHFPQPPEMHMQVTEVHFREIRRVMWCERQDIPCEFNGEWHRHWSGVHELSRDETTKYSVARWVREDPTSGTKRTLCNVSVVNGG